MHTVHGEDVLVHADRLRCALLDRSLPSSTDGAVEDVVGCIRTRLCGLIEALAALPPDVRRSLVVAFHAQLSHFFVDLSATTRIARSTT